MVAILDYGVGNLFSLQSSFAAIGAQALVTKDPGVIAAADQILLPGVGAFSDAASKLRQSGLDRVLVDCAHAGTPTMGICLGMQMLFERSFEYGSHAGLGLLQGEIRPIADVIDPALKIPHIGWNALHLCGEAHPLLRYVKEGDFVYFVHSYYAAHCTDSVIATAEYSAPLTAAVARGNICGCQFHPEKSGAVGLSILRAFCEMKKGGVGLC